MESSLKQTKEFLVWFVVGVVVGGVTTGASIREITENPTLFN